MSSSSSCAASSSSVTSVISGTSFSLEKEVPVEHVRQVFEQLKIESQYLKTHPFEAPSCTASEDQLAFYIEPIHPVAPTISFIPLQRDTGFTPPNVNNAAVSLTTSLSNQFVTSVEKAMKENFINFIKQSAQSIATMTRLQKMEMLKKFSTPVFLSEEELQSIDSDLSLCLKECCNEKKPIQKITETIYAIQTALRYRLRHLPISCQCICLKGNEENVYIGSPAISEAFLDSLLANSDCDAPLDVLLEDTDTETFALISELLEKGIVNISDERAPAMFFAFTLSYGLEELVLYYLGLFLEKLKEQYIVKISVEQAIKTGIMSWIELPKWISDMIAFFEDNMDDFETEDTAILGYKKEIESTILFLKIKQLSEKTFLERMTLVYGVWPKYLIGWATLRIRYLGKAGASFYSKIPMNLLKLPSAEVLVKAYQKHVSV